MSADTTETEVKLRFPGPEEALRRLRDAGAVASSPRVFEDNVLYDRADRSLSAAGQVLRLRRAGDRATLTYKGRSAEGTRHKVRTEHETAVDDPDAAERLLEALGFRPAWRYQKFRTTLLLEGVHATVDETPIGCFVELEGAPGAIDRAAERLGCRPADYLTASYHDLHPEGDLVF